MVVLYLFTFINDLPGCIWDPPLLPRAAFRPTTFSAAATMVVLGWVQISSTLIGFRTPQHWDTSAQRHLGTDVRTLRHLSVTFSKWKVESCKLKHQCRYTGLEIWRPYAALTRRPLYL